MFLKYLQEPKLQEFLPSRDGFKFLEYIVALVGWKLHTKSQLFQGIHNVWNILVVILAWHMLIGLSIGYVRDFHSYTPSALILSAQLVFNIPNSLIKGFIFFLNLWRLERAKEIFDLMDKRCLRVEEKIQVHRSVRLCNFIYLTYIMMYCLLPMTTFATALFKGKSPWNVYNPVLNWHDGTKELWIASFIEIIEVMIACGYNQVPDVFPVINGITLRVHIDLLRQRILRLRTDAGKSEDESYEELTACIKDHSHILELCKVIRPVISPTLFVQFLLVGLLLGLSLTNIFFFADLWTIVITAGYIIGVLAQTFPFCYICNMLEEDGYALTLAIFQSKWIDATPRYRSAIRLFLLNAQKTIEFNAGGIFPVCLRTNLSLAKFAFTVVTIVNQLNLAEKLKND